MGGGEETAFDLDEEESMKCTLVRGGKRRACLVGVEARGNGKWLGLKVGRGRRGWTCAFRTEADSLQKDRERERVCVWGGASTHLSSEQGWEAVLL